MQPKILCSGSGDIIMSVLCYLLVLFVFSVFPHHVLNINKLYLNLNLNLYKVDTVMSLGDMRTNKV